MKRMNRTKYVRRIAILTALTVLAALMAAMIPAAADTVSDEDIARIVTNGYDLSAFTVLDDTDEEVVISDLGVTNAAVHLCGQAHFTGEIGSMTLFFEGSAVGLLAEKGGFDIYIDDEPVGTVWAAAVGAPQVVFYTEALSNDSHVITVIANRDLASMKIGENYTVFEGFFVQTNPGTGSAGAEWTDYYTGPIEEPTAAPGKDISDILAEGYDLSEFTVLDDTDEEVHLSDLAETKAASHLFGQASFTGGIGSMSLDFEGNAVGLIAEKGGFDIYIDDDLVESVWAAASGAPKVVYYKGDLSNDTHNITVVTNPDLATEHIGEKYSVLEGFFVQTVPGKGSADGAPLPTDAPTAVPTEAPTEMPTAAPTAAPTDKPADNTSAPVKTDEPSKATPKSGDDNAKGDGLKKAIPFIIMGGIVLAAAVVIAVVLIRKKKN
ncbi:MAG: hypothetical protein J5950_01810 [Clostridia bacterium]|nr:hypothetical protein [Clostridia bacterium]